MKKSIKLEEETRILLNQARAIILKKNPAIAKCTDEYTIRAALEKFCGGK